RVMARSAAPNRIRMKAPRLPLKPAGPDRARAVESTAGVHFSGEPFGVRDVQFHDPQVGITAAPALQHRPEGLLARGGRARFLPGISAVRLQQALEHGGPRASLGEDDEDGARGRIPLREDGTEAALRLD